MYAFTVRLSDVARCPKQSMLPRHFKPDGSCRCADRPAAQAEYDAALARLRAARATLDAC